MKTNFYKFFVLLTVLSVASCAKLDVPAEEQPEKEYPRYVFTSEFVKESQENTNESQENSEEPQIDKRVILNYPTNWHVKWELADKVSVFAADGSNNEFSVTGFNHTETMKEDGYLAVLTETTGSGKFEDGESYYGFFPYQKDNVIDLKNKTITTTIPTVQTPELNTFSEHFSVSESCGGTLKFYNVCGLIMFDITQDNIVSVSIKGGNNEILTGRVKVIFDESIRRPTWENVEGVKEVNLVSSTPFATGTYFATALPQTFSKGVTITMYKNDGTVASKSTTKAFTLSRSGKIHPPEIDVNHTWSKLYTITNAAEMQAFLISAGSYTANETVTIANHINMEGYDNLVTATSFAGTLDGTNASYEGGRCGIQNLNLETALFHTLTGTVRNVAIGKGSQLTVPDGADGAYIALNNQGTIDNCNNSYPITVLGGESTNDRFIGAFAAKSTGVISNCNNGGAITATGTAGRTCIGGIVGEVTEGEVSGNINTSGAVITYTGTGMRDHIGAIIGCSSSGSVTSNTNNAALNLTLTGSSASVWDLTYIGGVAGETQSGSVSANTSSGNITVSLSGNNPIRLGGVVGNSSADVNSSSCTGAINVSGGTYNSEKISYIGGIVGNMGGVLNGKLSETVSGGHVYDVINYSRFAGNIYSTSPIKMYVGGLAGKTQDSMCFYRIYSPYNSTTKTGGVYVNAPGDGSMIGGLCGVKATSQAKNDYNLSCRVDVQVPNSNETNYAGHFYGWVDLSISIRVFAAVMNGLFVKGSPDTRGALAGKITGNKFHLYVGQLSNSDYYGGGYVTIRKTNTVNKDVIVSNLALFNEYAVGTGDDLMYISYNNKGTEAEYGTGGYTDPDLARVRVLNLGEGGSGSDDASAQSE